jgi:AcrR family transcriptional regulator
MSERLGKQAWVKAGLGALARQGVEAVRVERLAETLGVTKGSFYWHFKDRDALLAALIEAWRDLATDAVITQVEAQGGDPGARMRNLFTIVITSDGTLDQAVRAWAAQDETVRVALAAVDQRRLDYLIGLFRGLKFTAAESKARARLAYHALIGQFTMGTVTSEKERLTECLDIVYPMLVRRP